MKGSIGALINESNFLTLPLWVKMAGIFLEILLFLAFWKKLFIMYQTHYPLKLLILYPFTCFFYTGFGLYLHEMAHSWSYYLCTNHKGQIIYSIISNPRFRFYNNILINHFKLVLISPIMGVSILLFPIIFMFYFNLTTPWLLNGLLSSYFITVSGSIGDIYLLIKIRKYSDDWVIVPFVKSGKSGFLLEKVSSY